MSGVKKINSPFNKKDENSLLLIEDALGNEFEIFLDDRENIYLKPELHEVAPNKYDFMYEYIITPSNKWLFDRFCALYNNLLDKDNLDCFSGPTFVWQSEDAPLEKANFLYIYAGVGPVSSNGKCKLGAFVINFRLNSNPISHCVKVLSSGGRSKKVYDSFMEMRNDFIQSLQDKKEENELIN